MVVIFYMLKHCNMVMQNMVRLVTEQAEVTAEIDELRDQLKPKVKELNELGMFCDNKEKSKQKPCCPNIMQCLEMCTTIN